MVNIPFVPSGPLTECVNISIERDLEVEEDEVFSFVISSNQLDSAVLVGMPDTSNITIVDEEDGKWWEEPLASNSYNYMYKLTFSRVGSVGLFVCPAFSVSDV